MEQAILEAEKFRAEVEKPPGMNSILTVNSSSEVISPINRRPIGNEGLTDDDFFHVTCHVDHNLRAKIENGDFVDLDKFLPKDNMFHGNAVVHNQTKLEWVQSEGSTYLVPAKSNSRINCFRRWEQAFHIYATIYCTKNPERAREVWQYVSVINTASLAYSWNNVYNYDVVFRQ